MVTQLILVSFFGDRKHHKVRLKTLLITCMLQSLIGSLHHNYCLTLNKFNMKKLSFILASVVILFLASCSNESAETTDATDAKKDSAAVKTEVVPTTSANFANVDAMVEAAKKEITAISAEDLNKMAEAEEPFLLIDVREKAEFDKGFIPGAVNIPRGLLEYRIAKTSFWEKEMIYMPKKDELIVVNCKKGGRGALAAQSLKALGYTNVKNLDGGFKKWELSFADKVEKNVEASTDKEAVAEDDGGC